MKITWGKFMIIEIVVLLGLVAGVLTLNPNYWDKFSQTVIARSYISLKYGNISSGHYQGIENNLDISKLEPGDIILVGDSGCSYGHFSHTAMYIGDNKTIEGFIDTGVVRRDVIRLRQYDYYAVLRPKAAPAKRYAAAVYAQSLEDNPVWVAFKPGEQYWSCSKIPYTAYLKQGIDLDQSPDIIPTPDVFYKSPYVTVVQEGGL